MHDHLKSTTLEKRLQMAQSFYLSHLTGITANLEQTQDLLVRVAPQYRRSSWRNLRAAVATFWWVNDEHSLADKIRKTQYPNVELNKSKPRRCKKISEQDVKALFHTCRTTKNVMALAVLLIARYIGCRPCEMNNIEQVGESQFLITSGKKRNDRGLDRVINITSQKKAEGIVWAINIIKDVPTRTLQNRFEYLTKKTFPKRGKHPTIYSFRHQLGSNLKTSDLSREAIAYIMGHRSPQSVDTYGDSRSGGQSLFIRPAISEESIKKLVLSRPLTSFRKNIESHTENAKGSTPNG